MKLKVPGFLQAADAIVPCPACKAEEGTPCTRRPKDKIWKDGYVHLGRRVRRLLLTASRPSRRAEFEAEAVKMLIDYLKERKAN